MILPTIHTNGTSPEMLRRGYEDARLAVEAAIRAMHAIEFNGRDYYPQGPDAWKRASREHGLRLDALACVCSELETLETHVQDAIDAREAQKR